MRYRVKEIWSTVQGEGANAGQRAVFVRFVACNMWSGEERDRERDAERNGATCPMWCDTDFRKAGSRSYTLNELVEAIETTAVEPTLIVCTGGEPLLQLDVQFVRALRRAGHMVAVETNGTVSLGNMVDCRPDWITVSPKLPDDQLKIESCDEVKLVVPDYLPSMYPTLVGRCRMRYNPNGSKRKFLWVQPEDGPRFDMACEIARTIVQDDPRWRISVQGHKVIGAE